MSEYNNYNQGYGAQQNSGGELGWEDEINDEYVELQPGRYQFRVLSVTRGRHSGASWMPACNKADIQLEIIEPTTGIAITVKDSVFLHQQGKFKICRLFESLGMKKKGDPLRMNWNIVGKTGWCETKLKEGERGGKFVNVKTYIPAEDIQAQPQMSQPMGMPPAPSAPQTPQTPPWNPGAF